MTQQPAPALVPNERKLRASRNRWRVFALAVAALCVFLYSLEGRYPNSPNDLRLRGEVPQDERGFSVALYQSTGVELQPGNALTLVENGALFDRVVEEIARAQRSVHILTFIWRHSGPSDRIVEALEARAPGVACRVLVDDYGSVRFEDEVRPRLERAGCEVRLAREWAPHEGLQILKRNHRKIVVVDGRVGITGGFGIWRSWEGEGLSPDEWRETNVRVEGPAVRQMQQAFAESWHEAGGALLGPEDFPPLAPVEGAPAAFVASSDQSYVTDAERQMQLLFAAAQERIWIANAYFIPTTALGDLLIEKRRQGVDVRVLTAGPVHDLPPLRLGQRSTYERMLEGGIRIWEYQPSMMHAKTVVVDDALVAIGSINLDSLSMKDTEEGQLIALDPALASRMAASFEADLEHSREIERERWAARPFTSRIAEQLTAIFGGFL